MTDLNLTYSQNVELQKNDPKKNLTSKNTSKKAYSYYPFGMTHKGYNNVVSSNANTVGETFKFNGVELEEGLGLSLYEMDVRSYDPVIARFTSIDPVIHFDYSPYQAFDNNPIYWADPSGADSTSFIQELWDNTPNDGRVHHYNNEGEKTGTSDPEEAVDGGELGEVVVTANGPKTSPNNVGGVNVQLDGKTYVFPVGGDLLYMPYQNPENLEYYRNNYKKFIKEDGSIATFDEVFISRSEWWEEVGVDMAIEMFEGLGVDTGTNLEGRRLVPVKKYEKWKWHFPPKTQQQIQQRAVRSKEIKEMNLLRQIPVQHLSTEEYGRLVYLEKKWKK